MKLFKNIYIGSVFATSNQNIEKTCDVDALSLPANAKGWDCEGSEGNRYVVKGTKCYLKCADGYTKYNSEFFLIISSFHQKFKPLDLNFNDAREMENGENRMTLALNALVSSLF